MTKTDVCGFLLGHDDYLILTHRRPDGDAIGSAAALCRALRCLGKRAYLYANPQFTPRFASVLDGLVSGNVSGRETVISVDIASGDLMPFGSEQIVPRLSMAIDHHQRNSLDCPKLVLSSAAACGEIIYALLGELGVSVDLPMAEALYIAVSTDTGCFRYSNTTADTLRTAAALLETGLDAGPINRVFFDTKSRARIELESRMTAGMEFYAGGLVAVALLPSAWLEELHATEDDVDSIAGFVRSVEGVEIGVTIRDVENGEGKISVRTGPGYNASELCAKLGGGGHAAAAGANVPGGIEAAREAVLQVLKEYGIDL